jgi:GTPase SAR1 family protein
MVYNSDQENALNQMTEFYQSDDRLFLLKGYAGTGKTTIINELVTRLKQRDKHMKICYTAPTNKATKVLGNMATERKLPVEIMTTYQLLNIKPSINQTTGKQEFKPVTNWKDKKSMDDYDLIVVDEASMINKDVHGFLNDALPLFQKYPKIIFMGDPAQLPPVNENESEIFSSVQRSATLTQVMRYKGDIIHLATAVRDNLYDPKLQRFNATAKKDTVDEGVISVTLPDWHSLIEDYFSSEEFKKNPDYVRVLAYTNATVSNLNMRIRKKLFNTTVEPFVPGDRLIAKEPCIDGEQIILQNSSECLVTHVREVTYATDYEIFELTCRTEYGDTVTLRVLKPESQGVLAYKLKGLTFQKNWQAFYALKNQFHNVDYCYAMTVHKSQGSTFQNVFVALSDIFINKKVVERNQLYYVAVTRASKKIFMYGY